jgi:hypothetical protein
MLQAANLPLAFDLQVFHVRSNAPKGPTVASNEGHAAWTEGFLSTTLGMQRREFSQHELVVALGYDPYK